MHTIRARAIRAYEEEDVLVVAFPDDAGDEPKQFVLLQRHLAPNEDDVALGHDQVHLSVESNEEGRYGGVLAAKLEPTRLHLTLAREAAKELKIDPEVEIDLTEVASYDAAALGDALARALAPVFLQRP